MQRSQADAYAAQPEIKIMDSSLPSSSASHADALTHAQLESISDAIGDLFPKRYPYTDANGITYSDRYPYRGCSNPARRDGASAERCSAGGAGSVD